MAIDPSLESILQNIPETPHHLIIDIAGWIRAIQIKLKVEGKYTNRLVFESEIGLILQDYLNTEYRISSKGPFPVEAKRYGLDET